MVCKECGARVPRDARRCPRCGARVSGARRRGQRRRASRLPRLSWLWLAIALAAVVLIGAAVGIALNARRGGGETPEYAQVLDRYFTALEKRDAEAYAATRPQAYIDYLTREDGGTYLNYTIYVNDLAETIDERMNGYAAVCGSGIRISFRVDQALDVGPYLPRIAQTLTGWYGFPEDCVEQVLLINGSYTVRGNTDARQYEITDTLLLKIDGTWYFSPDIGTSWRE